MNSALLPVYRRSDIIMERGQGAYLFDTSGKRYLDFASGIAVNALGHSHPKLVKALQEQAERLWHCSNMYHTEILDSYAARLINATFADKVFFCSSGTEAVEAAIKAIRRYHFVAGSPQRTQIISAEGGFHGRTLGALSACGHTRSREGVEPLLPGFVQVPFNDIPALEAAITENTAGIMLETIQGEGGVRIHSHAYLRAAREMAKSHGLLLFLDEVQCGFGRTGHLYAYEASGIIPDLLTSAKGIGGGFPLAALLLSEDAARGMTPGSHGSTYGSNPLAMAVGNAVLEEVLAPGFLEHVRHIGQHLKSALESLCMRSSNFSGVTGQGLMLGLIPKPGISAYEVAEKLRGHGLLTSPAVSNVLRILPPLVIDEEESSEAVSILNAIEA